MCEHCWHAPGEFQATYPPRWLLVCCLCGEAKHESSLEKPETTCVRSSVVERLLAKQEAEGSMPSGRPTHHDEY